MKKNFLLLPATLVALLCEPSEAQTVSTGMVASSSGSLPAAFQTYPVRFSGTSEVLRTDVGENRSSLEAISENIREYRAAIDRGEYRIRVASNIAPVDMTEQEAYARARQRALVLKSYLISSMGVREEDFSTRVSTEGRLSTNDRLTVGLVPVKKADDSAPVAVGLPAED